MHIKSLKTDVLELLIKLSSYQMGMLTSGVASDSHKKKCSGGIDNSKLILELVKLNDNYCKVFLTQLEIVT